MKRLISILMIVIVTAFMCADMSAQRRNDNGRGNSRDRVESSHRPKPNKPGRPGSSGQHKPGKPDVGHRPGNGVAPGRPVHPGNGANHGRPVRPGGTVNSGWHTGHRPGGTIMRPPAMPWHRPVPPRHWHPSRRVPVLSSVLGITFGMAVNSSLARLQAANYVVNGYDGNEVFLANVPMEGYYWPEATLYYASGGLSASRFFYATAGYDLGRYNGVYSRLYNAYGAPVSVSNMAVTWYGGNNGYITLDFAPMSTPSGLRYITTLTLGI